ncbi:putative vacuolar protein sorting-associated protein 62 [Tanacetum coccineum]
MSSLLLSWLSVHMLCAILIFLVACKANAYRPFNDFSTRGNSYKNAEVDVEEIVSFDQLLRPAPVYPEGGGFARGAIDLGGVEVFKAKYFKKIWDTQNGGLDNIGASFYEPTNIPTGFHLLGHYCKLNTKPMLKAVLTAKDTTRDPALGAALERPIDYTLVWTSKGTTSSIGQDVVDGYIWLPIPPHGYKTIGHIVTTSPVKPSLDKVRCVRSDLTDLIEVEDSIWGSSNINLYSTKPIGAHGRLGVPTGTFLALNHRSGTHKLACLKMAKKDANSTHPTIEQIKVMITAFAPLVYFHPDEEFFPSSVTWFFNNGAQVFDPSPHAIINDGEFLPRNGTIDDSFLDLPFDQSLKYKVKRGSLSDAVAYIHAKPAPTFTDIVIWLYYPFNGGSKFQVGPYTLNLGRIGEHVGDWEHIRLRIENYSGVLQSIYLSQHAKGEWIPADKFEYINGRPVVYASLHDHAHYSAPTKKIHFNAEELVDPNDKQRLIREVKRVYPRTSSQVYFAFGPLDEAEKSNHVFDILASPSSYAIVSVDNCAENVVPPPWLDYTGRWGPKITYAWKEEAMMVIDNLPLPLWVKLISRKIISKLPAETYGEEGPEGPKMKANWNGDERT